MSPEAQDHFSKVNLNTVGGAPAAAKTLIAMETQVWGGVIKEAHIPAIY